jgi:hypothetical protein
MYLAGQTAVSRFTQRANYFSQPCDPSHAGFGCPVQHDGHEAAVSRVVGIEEEDAMVTLSLIATVGTFLLLVAYVLSWPPTMPR